MNEREEEPAPVDLPAMPDLDALDEAMEAIDEEAEPEASEEAQHLAEAAEDDWDAGEAPSEAPDDDGWAVEW